VSADSSKQSLVVALIRSATAADIPAMMSLAALANTAAQWSEGQYSQMIRQTQPRRMVLVLEGGSIISGFLVALSVADDWEIENIVIREDIRRRGLSSQLLKEFIERVRAEGSRGVFLEVRHSNRAARALYEKLSFTESGRRKNYYSNPSEDAVLYRLTLS
jgi:[ribosomal protein S18]-alanine N-acetyltransferase